MTELEQDNQTGKLKVDIYVPLNACACQWENFMNSIFKVLTEYNEFINFETKNLNSEEAHRLNLQGNSAVIGGKEIVSSSSALKRKLREILKERGVGLQNE